MYGLKHRKAQNVGIFQYIHPVVTVIAAWFILAEFPDKKLIAGAVLIFMGIYLSEIHLSRRRYKARAY
jgi:drug/metabolite transporter (DMT)-like permease